VEALVEIASRAIADYGFRQVVLWSPEDVLAQWGLSESEARVLQGPMRRALESMPVPVEPANIPDEQRRMVAMIENALGS